ncbi:Glutamine--tRNA ligase, partial [Dissostichus eleginoides]
SVKYSLAGRAGCVTLFCRGPSVFAPTERTVALNFSLLSACDDLTVKENRAQQKAVIEPFKGLLGLELLFPGAHTGRDFTLQ